MTMNCLLQNTLEWATRRGKRLEVVSRYLKIRYRIKADVEALRRRISPPLAVR